MSARILLVEDEPTTQLLVAEVLKSANYSLICADNCSAAIEACSRNQLDLILLNHRLPELPGGHPQEIGLMLLQIIKTRWPKTHVVMFTATDAVDIVFQAGRWGASGYFTKPFENEELLEAVAKVLKEEAQANNSGSIGKLYDSVTSRSEKVSTERAEKKRELSRIEKGERDMIVDMLSETGGNKVKTASRLGLGRQTLYNKIKAYGIEV